MAHKKIFQAPLLFGKNINKVPGNVHREGYCGRAPAAGGHHPSQGFEAQRKGTGSARDEKPEPLQDKHMLPPK